MLRKLTVAFCAFGSIAAIASAGVTANEITGSWTCAGQNEDDSRSMTGTLTFDDSGQSTHAFNMKFGTPGGIVYITANTSSTYEVSDTAIVSTVETFDIEEITGEGKIGKSLSSDKFKKKFAGNIKKSALRDPISTQNIVSYSPEELVIFNPNNEITQTCTR